MRARLLADADLRVAILRGLLRREPPADFLPAQGTIAEGMGDPLVLALAADLDRVLVSHDEDSMPVHFYRFVASRESPGLILIRQRMPTGVAIEEAGVDAVGRRGLQEPDYVFASYPSEVVGDLLTQYWEPDEAADRDAISCSMIGSTVPGKPLPRG